MAETDKPALAPFHYPKLARSLGKRQEPRQSPAATVMPAEAKKPATEPRSKPREAR
jgi:hypothetical protein